MNDEFITRGTFNSTGRKQGIRLKANSEILRGRKVIATSAEIGGNTTRKHCTYNYLKVYALLKCKTESGSKVASAFKNCRLIRTTKKTRDSR